MASHFIWRDPSHILVWARHPSHGDRFYLVKDRKGGSFEVVAPDVMTRDGHCTYLPDTDWIINDTYPDAERNQSPSRSPLAFCIRTRVKTIAVGTVIADRPPHRSVRAELPHTAPTSDVDLQTARSDKDAESSASAAIAG